MLSCRRKEDSDNDDDDGFDDLSVTSTTYKYDMSDYSYVLPPVQQHRSDEFITLYNALNQSYHRQINA